LLIFSPHGGVFNADRSPPQRERHDENKIHDFRKKHKTKRRPEEVNHGVINKAENRSSLNIYIDK
jgi:hypothetical protein